MLRLVRSLITTLALAVAVAGCATSAHGWPATPGNYGKGHNKPAALKLVINPSSQTVTRSGAGSITTSVAYAGSGGTDPLTYATTATGLTVSGGTTTTPSFSKTLTAGQDLVFSITGTVTDALGNSTSTPGSIEFIASTPPVGLSLAVTPATQTISRSGAGAISASVNYAATGGSGTGYTYSTAAPGLAISGGTTTTPTVSTTLTNGQNSVYTVTGTVTDSLSATASTPVVVQFTSTAVTDPLAILARGIVADNVTQTQNQDPSANTSPYARTPKVSYSTTDFQNMAAAGLTYIRIPVDVQQILPALPLPTSYLQLSSGVYSALSTNTTKTVSTTAPLIGPAGCGNVYVSNACTVEFMLQYLDQVIFLATQQGLAVDLVPFVAGTLPTASQGGVSPDGDLQTDMGTGDALYGYASFEDMLQQANMVLVGRYRTAYPLASQVFFELYNEPHYVPGTSTAYLDPAVWNAATIAITAAIRGVDTTHWIISDCVGIGAKAERCQYLTPTSDTQTVYSFHAYNPASFVIQGSGAVRNPYLVYPRPSSGESAIGRPGGIAPAYMPFAAPVFGTPSGYTVTAKSGCSDSVPAPVGTPVTAWAANATTALTAHAEKVCTTGTGLNPTTTLEDLYTGGTGSYQVTKADLLTNTADGVQLALNWAAIGGHSGPLSGSVLKIIAGEIGVTKSADYLSGLQYLQDIIATLNAASVVGGQASVPWDYWAFSGVQFGLRPKSQPALTHWCLYPAGTALAGYDQDWWERLKTPAGSMTPHCSGGTYATPGY